MGKKFNIKNTFALIAVLLIWGYVVKSKLGWFGSDSTDNALASNFMIAPIKNFTKDTFQLNLNPRDPFLGGKKFVQSTAVSGVNNNNSAALKNVYPITRQKHTQASIQWPKIAYFGYVSNRNKKNPACLIQINGRVHNMHKGDENNSVVLKSIYKDSVIVLFKEEFKTVFKP